MISFKEKLGYGFGDAASSMFWKLFGMYLLFFYTDVFGMEAAAVGTMFLITRIWDSFFDPVVGVIADRTESKWGKFRPYLLFLAIPFGVIGVFTFYTPAFSTPDKVIYAYVTYSLMMIIYSGINVPYASLLGVISPDLKDRNVLSTYSGVTPSHNLVSAYEYVGEPDPNNPYANRDPRLYASVVTNGSTWNGRVIDQLPGGSDDMTKANASRTGYYLKKFLTDNLNLIQGQTAQHNWVAYRYAEILLNYAEAMNEAFGPTDVPAGFTLSATDAINMVRNRASADLPLISTESKDEFRSAIKHERRIELAFEDHRYWDLLRWKDAMQVLNQPIMGVKVVEDGESVNYVEIKVADRVFNERNYYLPFLRSEIVNSNNTLKQNEGY
jgi:hypothetical protein